MSDKKYEQRGVSASKSDVHKSISNLSKGLYPTAFCKVLPDIVADSDEYVNIMHADTAGTKTSLAYIYWKETGDMSVWEDIVQDAIVMNIDDLLCVGCDDKIILSSTIGRNKHLIPGEVVSMLINASQKFIDKMKHFGIDMRLAGGETADVGDIVRTVDVGITAFARMKKEDLIINDIKPGNVIIGFSSFGKADYEAAYNSGVGSNGLTSLRHDLLSEIYREKYPESYAPETDKQYIYSGKHLLTEKIVIENESVDIGKFMLSPTRTYLPVLKEVFAKYRKQIDGIIHCTGGAQTKVLKFVNNRRIIKDNLFQIPLIFSMIKDYCDYDINEMYEVFNMGHRMEMYIDEKFASDIISISQSFGVDARVVGRVEECLGNELVISQ